MARTLVMILLKTAMLFFCSLLGNLVVSHSLPPTLPAGVAPMLGNLAGFLAGLLFALLFRQRPAQWLTFSRGRLKHPIGCGLSLLFGIQTLGFLADLISSITGQSTDHPVNPAENWLITFLAVVILSPLLEEMLYRGLIMGISRPTAVSAPAFSVVLQGILFGLMHSTPSAMLYAAAGGILLGYFAAKSGSLRFSSAVHIVNNFIAFIQLLLQIYAGLPIALLFSGLVWLIGGIGTIWLMRQMHKGVETDDEISKYST